MEKKMKETLHHVKASTLYKREHKEDYGREKIEILYEDDDLVVILKPTGLLSVPYPGSKSRTALDLLEKILRGRGELSKSHKPLTVHRLDRDTSGVMMFALNEATQKKVMDSWHKMVTERLYRAVAENPKKNRGHGKNFDPLPDFGMIDDPLAQNACHVGYVPQKKDEHTKTVVARTHYRVVERGSTHTLFELSLDTGRKNQIRAHLASKGYPLAGDENYRANTDPFHRLMLHARTLDFIHPTTGKKMHFEVPEPEEWLSYVKKGDPHPEEPVWKKERLTERRSEEKFPSVKTKPLSRKAERGMDFIARGKSRSGK